MNLPEDGVYVREDFLNENPDICRKFIAATISGWNYAFANKDETVNFITNLANKTEHKTTVKKQLWMLDVVQTLMDLNSTVLKQEDFERATEMLKELKMVRPEKVPTYKDFFIDVMKK